MKGLNPWVISKVGWVWWSWWTLSNTQTNVNSGPVTTATVPYIRDTSETIARILQPCNIRVAHKPITTLRRPLTNVRDTARLLTLVKPIEALAHDWAKTNERREMVTSTITLQTKHQIDWDSATCITYSTNYCQRLILESWFTILKQTPLNRSQQLRAP